MILALINNIAFLIALVAAGQIVISRFHRRPLNRQVLLGLLFGGVALLGMANPLNFSPGVIFDGRTIVLSVVGVVGGGVAALIATAMAALYRYQLGGAGATVGVMVALQAALLGVLARHWWLRSSISPQPIHYLALGILVQLVQLALFTQIPNRAGYAFIEHAWWVNLLLYPLATMLLCLIFRNYEQQLTDQEALSSAKDAVIAAETASTERFHAYFDHSIIGLAITSPENGWIEVNDALCATLGYTRDELTRMTWTELTYPEDLAPDLAQFNRMLKGEIKSYTLDKRFIHKDGHLVYTRLAVSNVRKLDGSIDYIVAMVDDITERKAAEVQLRKLSQAVEQSSDSIVITNLEAKIEYVNEAFVRNTGYSREEAIGRNPRVLQSGSTPKETYASLWKAMTEGQPWNGEFNNKRKDGSQYTELATISPIRQPDGVITHYVAVKSDITDRKLAEDKIQLLAFSDPLTGLPNRRLLMDRLEQAMVSAQRHKHQDALLFIDMDDFKTLNDSLGHDLGDQLLQQIAERVLSSVREGDTVARLGGDEFVVLLEYLDESLHEAAMQAEAVARKIHDALRQTYQLVGHTYHSSASIGITLFGGIEREKIEEPLKRGELAMYKAKDDGRDNLRFYESDMSNAINSRATLEADLHKAVARSEFLLYYQAQVDHNAYPTGVEALVRWRHTDRGLVSPAEFIPVAESSGLILPLGHWVLHTACQQLATWALRPVMAHLTIAVNVSARQFRLPDFVEEVFAILEATGANPNRLKLELTESLLLDNMQDVITKMAALKAIGVGFSLDDFGTGYSSLAYLKRLPLDQLKIDQGFVRDILTDANDAAIAKMVIALAESMGLNVIAEGVETQAQRDTLDAMGCHSFQGYLFSKPLPIEEFEVFAQTHLILPPKNGLHSIPTPHAGQAFSKKQGAMPAPLAVQHAICANLR